MNLGPTINTPYREGAPRISADGFELYFDDVQTPRPGGFGGSDLWQVSIHPKLESIRQDSDTELIQEPVENSDRKEVMQRED